MIILILFAFLAGIVTVLSPCILPVLPIVLSGGISGGKKKPLGVISGFVLSFTFFTLFLTSLVSAFGISADALRTFSMVVIGLFGLSLLVPKVQAQLERMFQVFSNLTPNNQGDGFGSGLLIGLSLGLLWTPCVGPILASVISLAITGSVTGSAAFITFSYALGTAIPMLAIMYGGRNLLMKVPWLLSNTAHIQKGFGVLMVATAIAIFFQWDRQFQTWVLTTFPSYGTGLTQFEEVDVVKNQLEKLTGSDNNEMDQMKGKPLFEMQDKKNPSQLPTLFEAPELTLGGQWFNSEPLTMEQLKGKVVLIDFWTYSCINCIRTLPYLRNWHRDYADKGLVIIGVHAPEFEFEKNPDNVAKAIEDFELKYAVMQDNDFATWRSYNNRYWPAKYLVDKDGIVRYSHFGEGKYVETENAIRSLLDEEPLDEKDEQTNLFNFGGRRITPETYLGYERAQSYTQREVEPEVTKEYELESSPTVSSLSPNGVALEGQWQVGPESATAQSDKARLHLNFQAKNVYLVLSAEESELSQGEVTIYLDGQPLSSDQITADMNDQGMITVTEPRKYDLVNLSEAEAGKNHIITIEATAGISAFAFTFGS